MSPWNPLLLLSGSALLLGLGRWAWARWQLWARARRLDRALGPGSGKAFVEAAAMKGQSELVQGFGPSLRAWEEGAPEKSHAA